MAHNIHVGLLIPGVSRQQIDVLGLTAGSGALAHLELRGKKFLLREKNYFLRPVAVEPAAGEI